MQLLFGVVLRNRNYFVHMARYINEQRRLFLSTPALGFQNISRIYTDPKQPRFNDLRSTHLLIIYTMALTNSILMGVLFFVLWNLRLCLIVTMTALALGAHLLTAINYLRSKETNGAEGAVFSKQFLDHRKEGT